MDSSGRNSSPRTDDSPRKGEDISASTPIELRAPQGQYRVVTRDRYADSDEPELVGDFDEASVAWTKSREYGEVTSLKVAYVYDDMGRPLPPEV